ncbi:MAG: hypothetical protein KKC68_01180 [Candidatus Thermoplasmatota archaeon]|nr:hypothetical protein [Candidatus Thermoplasmatota archaeon]MBU1940363.1 hypothetical protein [Candidatus Thermoplasmatota archaeon]
MIDWDDCLDYKVKKVRENPEQAHALVTLAYRRLDSLKKRRKDEYPQLLIESYYEVIKEYITALLVYHGFKSYSHECLIAFLQAYYPDIFDESQLQFLDNLRKLRTDIQYRGRDVADDYLLRNQKTLETILTILGTIIKNEFG